MCVYQTHVCISNACVYQTHVCVSNACMYIKRMCVCPVHRTQLIYYNYLYYYLLFNCSFSSCLCATEFLFNIQNTFIPMRHRPCDIHLFIPMRHRPCDLHLFIPMRHRPCDIHLCQLRQRI